MKFGKSLSAEARNNRGLAFINFKHLKRVLKRSAIPTALEGGTEAENDRPLFEAILREELEKVNAVYWEELSQIMHLHRALAERLPSFDGITQDPATYTTMSFEDLQSHLQNLCGVSSPEGDPATITATSSESSAAAAANCAALCEFCITLGKISSRCKQLRRCVLWNTIAIVKILKKQQKTTTAANSTELGLPSSSRYCGVGAAQLLSQQDWYTSPDLGRIISLVETKTEEFMLKLTGKPPSRERFECPICLEIICDPVALRTCGHRFCWSCLCLAFFGRPENTLERCPSCRSSFPLDPDAFEVDGILRRFLKTFFPEEQKSRSRECTAQELRSRLEKLQQNKGAPALDGGIACSAPAKGPGMESPSQIHAPCPTGYFKLRAAPSGKASSVSNCDVVHRVVEFLLMPEENRTSAGVPVLMVPTGEAVERPKIPRSSSDAGEGVRLPVDTYRLGFSLESEPSCAWSANSNASVPATSETEIPCGVADWLTSATDASFPPRGHGSLVNSPVVVHGNQGTRGILQGSSIALPESRSYGWDNLESRSVPPDKLSSTVGPRGLTALLNPEGATPVNSNATATVTTSSIRTDEQLCTTCSVNASSCACGGEKLFLPAILPSALDTVSSHTRDSPDQLCSGSALWPIVLPLLRDLGKSRLHGGPIDTIADEDYYHDYYDDDDEEEEEEEDETGCLSACGAGIETADATSLCGCSERRQSPLLRTPSEFPHLCSQIANQAEQKQTCNSLRFRCGC